MEQKAVEILQRIGFCDAALQALAQTDDALRHSAPWQAMLSSSLFEWPREEWKEKEDALSDIARQTGQSPYTLALMYLTAHLPALREKYLEKGIDEAFFLDAARDLKSKTQECLERHGVYGTANFVWHIPFYHLLRFALGRLQYEDRIYPGPDHACAGFTIREGDKILGMHIPSGSPLDRARRMDSYKKAFAFYHCTPERPLIVHCNSWLLNPDHRQMLPAGSNIVDFMDDFDPVGELERDNFPDAWRVFGKAAEQPFEAWPTDNTLRKAYHALLASGKKAKNGMGLLIFDGERLLTGRHADTKT